MKKICTVILAVAMLFLVGACNIKDVTNMAFIGDESISKGEFNFYLMQAKSQAMNSASQNGDTISDDEDWNTVMIDDVTAAEYAINLVKDNIKQALVLKAKALEEGESLTEEDLETVKTQKSSIIEQLGGRYNYEQVMTEYGFTLEDVENIIKTELLGQKITSKYFDTEDSENSVSDEDAQKKLAEDYVFTKHILISSEPETEEITAEDETGTDEETVIEDSEAATDETGEAAETEEDAEALKEAAKAKAEELIAQLNGGADFDALMKSNSADVDADGNLNGADGYLFTKGEMVSEFEEAAFALKEGEYTKEPVETTYGYHIIKRLPLPTEGDDYESAIESVKSSIINDKFEETIDKWAEELGLVFNEQAISRIKM